MIYFFSQPNQPVQEKEKQTKPQPKPASALPVIDHRSVDDLLTFINGQKMEEESLGTKSKESKAQKRARQKQKKVSGT